MDKINNFRILFHYSRCKDTNKREECKINTNLFSFSSESIFDVSQRRISERNTKGKLVFLFISEREYLRKGTQSLTILFSNLIPLNFSKCLVLSVTHTKS